MESFRQRIRTSLQDFFPADLIELILEFRGFVYYFDDSPDQGEISHLSFHPSGLLLGVTKIRSDSSFEPVHKCHFFAVKQLSFFHSLAFEAHRVWDPRGARAILSNGESNVIYDLETKESDDEIFTGSELTLWTRRGIVTASGYGMTLWDPETFTSLWTNEVNTPYLGVNYDHTQLLTGELELFDLRTGKREGRLSAFRFRPLSNPVQNHEGWWACTVSNSWLLEMGYGIAVFRNTGESYFLPDRSSNFCWSPDDGRDVRDPHRSANELFFREVGLIRAWNFKLNTFRTVWTTLERWYCFTVWDRYLVCGNKQMEIVELPREKVKKERSTEDRFSCETNEILSV